jgi:hypothetical protein
MAEPEAILAEHYKAVREEEMERIRHRDQYLILYSTAAGVLGGFFIKDQAWWGLLLAIPLLAAVISLLYSHTDVTLGALSHWLRYDYTRMLDAYRAANHISYPLDHWDGSTVHQQYVRSLVFGWRYIAVAVILGGTASVATVMVSNHLSWIASAVAIVVCAVAAIAPLWAWNRRIVQA